MVFFSGWEEFDQKAAVRSFSRAILVRPHLRFRALNPLELRKTQYLRTVEPGNRYLRNLDARALFEARARPFAPDV